jgi:D-inositol-3-phosphate glycosyltransferase
VLLNLVNQPDLLRRLSGGALRHASDFGWSATVDRLVEVYTGAVEQAAAQVRA